MLRKVNCHLQAKDPQNYHHLCFFMIFRCQVSITTDDSQSLKHSTSITKLIVFLLRPATHSIFPASEYETNIDLITCRKCFCCSPKIHSSLPEQPFSSERQYTQSKTFLATKGGYTNQVWLMPIIMTGMGHPGKLF